MTTTTLRRRLWKTPMRDLVRGRITGRLDIDRLLEDAGLSGQAADKVRAVVKRTRLWRLEKVDVAQELASHFIDGREAGTPMDELLERFGDERQTAKLIRKAKKRQRPYAWHVFAWARLCFGIVLGVYILSALYLLTGSPDIKTDYLAVLNRNAAAVPEDDAAWPLYREALLEMNLTEEREWDTPIPYYRELSAEQIEEIEEQNRQLREMYDGWHGFEHTYLEPPFEHSQWDRLDKSLHPDLPGWGATVAYLNDHQAQLDLIRGGAMKPGLGLKVGFESDYTDLDRRAMGMESDPEFLAAEEGKTFRDPDRALIGALLPHLVTMRRMGKLLCADAERAAEEGDPITALENILAVMGMADQADEHPLLINGLVGLSIRQLGYRTIRDLIIQHPDLWTDAQLRDLAHTIAASKLDFETWYDGERLLFYDYLQRTYTDDGHGGGQITRQGLQDFESYGSVDDPFGSPVPSAVAAASLPVAVALVAPRAEMRQMYDSLIDRAIVDSRQPLWRIEQTNSFDRALEEIMASHTKRLRYLPITIFMPAMSAVQRAIQGEAGHREGVMIGIALELYRRRHGAWPAALDDLTPGFLPSVPVDRLTGKPLRYLVTEDGPVVYSLGVDGDDDGGRPPVEADGDVANRMASPDQFTGQAMTDPEHDGDWVLWPLSADER